MIRGSTKQDRIEALLGRPATDLTPLQGGDLSQIFRVTCADGGTVIAKLDGPDPQAEAMMLRAIAKTGAPAARPVATAQDMLILEDLGPGGPPRGSAWNELAEALLRLHAPQLETPYGWSDPYAFGQVPIPAAQTRDWPGFWAEARLLPSLPSLPPALARRLDRLAASLPDHLPAQPAPTLLHGDLWTGNVHCAGDRLLGLIDPACAFGDREVDLAMLCLFGQPPRSFWEIYGPPAPGWPQRRAIYQLWPALVHLRLFGSGYEGLVDELLTASGP